MDVKPFKTAHIEEQDRRHEYQKEFFEQRKQYMNQRPQSFHPQQTFLHEKEDVEPQKSSVIDMDLIDAQEENESFHSAPIQPRRIQSAFPSYQTRQQAIYPSQQAIYQEQQVQQPVYQAQQVQQPVYQAQQVQQPVYQAQQAQQPVYQAQQVQQPDYQAQQVQQPVYQAQQVQQPVYQAQQPVYQAQQPVYQAQQAQQAQHAQQAQQPVYQANQQVYQQAQQAQQAQQQQEQTPIATQQHPAQPKYQPVYQPQQAQPVYQPQQQAQSEVKKEQTSIRNIQELPKDEPKDKEYLYKAFVLYFDNPTFIKTNEANDNYAVYHARVKSLLSNPRYLIVITESDYAPKGYKQKLNDMQWKSFQLRTINKEIVCPEISYTKENNGIFDDEIILQQRDKLAEKVIYQCRFNPLIIELLPSKKGSINDYPDKSTLEEAMDSFQCVIYFS